MQITHEMYLNKIRSLYGKQADRPTEQQMIGFASALVDEDEEQGTTRSVINTRTQFLHEHNVRPGLFPASKSERLAEWRVATKGQREPVSQPAQATVAPTPTEPAFDRQAVAETIRAFITAGSTHVNNVDAMGFAAADVTALLQITGLIDTPSGGWITAPAGWCAPNDGVQPPAGVALAETVNTTDRRFGEGDEVTYTRVTSISEWPVGIEGVVGGYRGGYVVFNVEDSINGSRQQMFPEWSLTLSHEVGAPAPVEPEFSLEQRVTSIEQQNQMRINEIVQIREMITALSQRVDALEMPL